MKSLAQKIAEIEYKPLPEPKFSNVKIWCNRKGSWKYVDACKQKSCSKKCKVYREAMKQFRMGKE